MWQDVDTSVQRRQWYKAREASQREIALNRNPTQTISGAHWVREAVCAMDQNSMVVVDYNKPDLNLSTATSISLSVDREHCSPNGVAIGLNEII